MFNSDVIASLNPLEFSLYTYINDHYDSVIGMSIRDLADATHVSTATIHRFCKKLDCDGYAEFKVRLKMHFAEELQRKRKHVYEDRSRWTQFFLRMDDAGFQAKIDEAVEKLVSVDQSLIVGLGNSAHIAAYGANYFMTFDRMCFAITDAYAPIPGQSDMRDYVIIVLSVSGETRDIIRMIDRFQRNHAYIIAITNSAESTLGKMANLTLPYYIQEEYIESYPHNITSQLPAVFIVETLVRRVNNAMFKR
ncbi:MAG: MurR/RpiR family transcriptional regulator [Bacilli bacterium]